ncbi:MAG: hypothetical protein WAX04_03185 [Oscillospiraceae bacterium]
MKLELLPEDESSKQDKLIKLFSYILSGILSLTAMIHTGQWIVPLAAKELGYSGAIGGEVIVIAFVGIAVYCLIIWLTKED